MVLDAHMCFVQEIDSFSGISLLLETLLNFFFFDDCVCPSMLIRAICNDKNTKTPFKLTNKIRWRNPSPKTTALYYKIQNYKAKHFNAHRISVRSFI